MTNHTHILIFTLGPVQNFIAEARRTVDLYAGSQLLVRLAQVAIQSVSDSEKVIYPANSKADVPNLFVAETSNPEQVAEQAERKLREKWNDFANQALKQANLLEQDNPVFQKIWERQRDHHLEVYWVAIPYDADDGNGYISAYQRAAEALAARKQTRNFLQSEEDGPKDSLSGNRSALRTTSTGSIRAVREYWEQNRQSQPGQLRDGEWLDTIGVMKRFIRFEDEQKDGEKFPSTSTVASASFARVCSKAELLRSLVAEITKFNQQGLDFAGWDTTVMSQWRNSGCFYNTPDYGRGFEYDGDLLYQETYTEQNLKSRYGITPEIYSQLKRQIETITKTLAQLYKNANGRPNPYYAILQMDGDSMGKHVSKCKNKKQHSQLSRDLDEFTQQAHDLVKKRGGYMVYAGGDDVLAFFPADCVLSAANDLASAYRKQFEDSNWDQQDNGEPFPFTASTGIAFAHHLYPLDAILAAAHRAEKQAKNKYDRNALCVTVLHRSGQTLEVGGKWAGERKQSAPNTVKWVEALRQSLENKELSSRFPYSVLNEAEVITRLGSDGREAMLRRLVKRHQSEDVSDEKRQKIQEWITDWTKWADTHDLPPDSETSIKPKQGFLELARWFGLARWLAQGGEI
jgi:CRISPR-associated protein Cmr2